ncbi:MAG TPA: hypothetical protein VNP92_17150 [Actinophytocola sp.]|nr:hypothetical protein [Actinophytocola sp.]
MEAIGDEALASRPWLAPIAAAAAMAVFGGALFVASGLNDAGPDRGRPAGGIPGTLSDCVAMPVLLRSVEVIPRGQNHGLIDQGRGRTPYRPAPGLLPQDMREVFQTLDSYREVVTVHLDPQRRHIKAWPSNVHNLVQQLASCRLGSKLGWTVAGEDGVGVVRVEVATSWEQSGLRLAHEDWRSARTDVPGVEEAFVVEYDGGMAVAATRTDGLTVAIDANQVDADPLLRRHSSTGISRFTFDTDDLLAIVADGRMTLP